MITLVVAVALLVAFIYVERTTARDPLIRLGLFANRSVAGANAYNLLARRRHGLVLLLRLPLPPARARDGTGADRVRSSCRSPSAWSSAQSLPSSSATGSPLEPSGRRRAADRGRLRLVRPDQRRRLLRSRDVLGPSIVTSIGFGLCLGPVVSTGHRGCRAARGGQRLRAAHQLTPDRRLARTRRPRHRRPSPHRPHRHARGSQRRLRARPDTRRRAPGRCRPYRPHRPAPQHRTRLEAEHAGLREARTEGRRGDHHQRRRTAPPVPRQLRGRRRPAGPRRRRGPGTAAGGRRIGRVLCCRPARSTTVMSGPS